MGKIPKGVQPEIVWDIFERISEVPRCSGKEQKLQEFIEKWAKENGVPFRKDDVGNVQLTRKAAPGCEDRPTLILQGHQDMVCEKEAKSPHDFSRDPIPLKVDGGRVAADGTSLGADNGIGMAISMALLIDPSLKRHGKLEAIFTVDEETGFTGIRNMKPDFFTGKRMINLDAEEIGVIIISSAGGGNTEYSIPVIREKPGDWEALRLEVGGLLGGHSGVDIHLPRLNANILLSQGLKKVNTEVPIRLIRIDGGTRPNAIPRSAYVEFLVPRGKRGAATRILEGWAAGLDRSEEKNLSISVSSTSPSEAANPETSTKVINLVSEIPQGVFSWSSEYEDLVQTSNNLGMLITEPDKIRAPIFSRTSDAEDFKKNQVMLRHLGEKYGVKTDQTEGSAGWKSSPDSPFLRLVERCYLKAYGKKPKVTGIHGGLECGIFVQLDPELEIVSLGPTIKNAHSPREYVDIPSVEILWNVIKTVIKQLAP